MELKSCGALHSRIGCKFWVALGATFGSCGAVELWSVAQQNWLQVLGGSGCNLWKLWSGRSCPAAPIPAACLGRAEQGQVSGTAHHIAHNYPTPQPPHATATLLSQLLLFSGFPCFCGCSTTSPAVTLAPYSTCCSRHPRPGLAHPWLEVAGAQVSQ